MKKIVKYNESDFDPDVLLNLKKDKKIYIVFSTFGEREADLVADKIGILKGLPPGFIDRIFLNHRRVSDESDRTESVVKKCYNDIDIIIANETHVPDMSSEKGKGADMRRTLYRINMEYMAGAGADDVLIVFLDADVVPERFGSHFVTGLAGAVLNGADFAKGGFWREMGRVKKYVAQPLFSAVAHPSITALAEFSYPLSGECAGTLSFFNSVSFWQIYGVETGILIEAVRGDYTLADVNLGLYDHEHNSDLSIQKMSFGIIRTYLKSLADCGLLTLNNGASISDTFRAEYINSDCERTGIAEYLDEKKYRPLLEVIR